MCSWDEETGHIDVHTDSYGWPLACRRSRGPQPGGGTGSRPAPGGIVELEEEFRAILRWGRGSRLRRHRSEAEGRASAVS